jgi:hypothetical protein
LRGHRQRDVEGVLRRNAQVEHGTNRIAHAARLAGYSPLQLLHDAGESLVAALLRRARLRRILREIMAARIRNCGVDRIPIDPEPAGPDVALAILRPW